MGMADEKREMSAMVEVEDRREGLGSSVASFTWHARNRSARRNVAPDAVDYVLTHGRMIQRTGVMFFFLGWRDIPPCDRRASWASRLEGSIVIVAPHGAVVTIYRNRKGLRTIARKMKYQLDGRNHAASCETAPPTTMMARVSA